MNGGGTGSLQGYRISEDGLRPIADSARSLDITPASGPSTFLMTPVRSASRHTANTWS